MKHWTTKAGNQVPLADLATSHLKNIISMLRRKGFVSLEEFHTSCAAAASLQGEMAQMYAESEVANMKIFAGLDALEAEYERRTDK